MVEDGSYRTCGLSLRRATMVIGCLDVIFAILRGLSPLKLSNSTKDGGSDENYLNYLELAVLMIIAVLEFSASVILLLSLKDRNFSRIKSWVTAQKVICVLYFIAYIVLFVLGYHWLDFILLILFHPIVIYFMPIVASYADQNQSI